MVLPQRPAEITATASSGVHCVSQRSWNVPLAPRPPEDGEPHAMPSRRRRCRRWLRARSLGWRRSRSSTFWEASGFRRRLFCWRSRSRCRGTVGVASGTAPSRSPTMSRCSIRRSGVFSPMHTMACRASYSSSSPGRVRSRMAASDSASRAASMTCADEQSMSRSRNRRAARVSQPTARSPSPLRHRCSYHAGEETPAP